MAQILDTNLYELSAMKLARLEAQIDAKNKGKKGRSRRSKIKTTENKAEDVLLEKEIKNQTRLKKFQDENIVLNGLYRLKYRFYKHDDEPLALIFNNTTFVGGKVMVPALNLHYLISREALGTTKFIKKVNAPRMARGFPPALIWEIAEKLPWSYIPYRLYRLEGIRPLEYIPVDDWEDVVGNENSRWQGFREF